MRPRPQLRGAAVAVPGIIVAGLLLALSLRAARSAGPSPRLDEPIVSAGDWIIDSLPNGLRYYVDPHRSHGDRTELRLVVDVGSVQEEDDERGIAHAVEHMVFRGTRPFPGGAIERWFESIGMRRGADVNATTGFDVTQYQMSVPTDRAGAIDTAIAMLASIAHQATFDESDLRRESSVLAEEWRWSRDIGSRIADTLDPLLYEGTPYAHRRVIGDSARLRRLEPAALRRFYEAWYRPELMAVVVVGEFDANEIEAIVKRRFGAIPNRPGARRARPVGRETPASAKGPRGLLLTDPDARSSSTTIWHLRSRQRYRTKADFRDALVAVLWRDLLRAHLEDAALIADSPLASARVEHRVLTRAMAAEVVNVTAMHGRTVHALEAVAAELDELAEHGPTKAELDERVRALLRDARTRAADGDAGTAMAGEFVDHFVNGNAVLTTRAAFDLQRELLPTIAVADIRALARAHAADSGTVVVLVAPGGDPALWLSPDSLTTLARKVVARAVDHGPAPHDVESLLAVSPPPGRIVVEDTIRDLRAYRWTLSNGMQVLLKPTSLVFDQIEFRAVAPGGASLASDDAYPSAYFADAIIGATGVGRIPGPRLRRWLDATSIAISPGVSDDAITLDGTLAPADAEAFFRLAHLYLTSPRRDTVAFRRYQARMVALVRDHERDPEEIFRDSVTALLTNHDSRRFAYYAPVFSKLDLGQALDFWSKRTANGAGFTVAIVGDFSLGRIRPLVERYLASVPSGVPEHAAVRQAALPDVAVQRDLREGMPARARSAIGVAGRFDPSSDNMDALSAVREVVEKAIRDRLREDMGGTYVVDATLGIDVAPPARYTLTIEFETAPDRVDALTAAATDELARLHREGPTRAQFLSARETRLRDFDGRMETNSFWAGELATHARYGWPLSDIATHRRDAEEMTFEDLREACRRYIPASDYIRVTMRPRP